MCAVIHDDKPDPKALNTYQAASQATKDAGPGPTSPQGQLADMFAGDLGVTINPQALRVFIRSRWSRIAKLAHAIHGSTTITENDIFRARIDGISKGHSEGFQKGHAKGYSEARTHYAGRLWP